jgi:AraC-like DNA-binding protein
MDLRAVERLSDSPYVQTIWYSSGQNGGSFISIANPTWSLVVSKVKGQTIVTVRGPETYATPAFCPPDGEFWGINFNPGTLMPHFPANTIKDRCDVNLVQAGSQSFWLGGSAYPLFDFENVDTFVERLVHDGLLIHDPVVESVLNGRPLCASLRTVQRRFLQATGISYGSILQIRRARYATTLLNDGVSILDTVALAGYSDQPHLTRSLKYFIGQTPGQILDRSRMERLSFLFKTEPLPVPYA